MAKEAQQPKYSEQTQPTVNSLVLSDETPDKLTIRQPLRAQLSPEETRACMEAFPTEREEAFVATIREDES